MLRSFMLTLALTVSVSAMAAEESAVRICGLVKKVDKVFEFSIDTNNKMIAKGADSAAQLMLTNIYAHTVGQEPTRLRACLHGKSLPAVVIDNEQVEYTFFFDDVTPFIAPDLDEGFAAPEMGSPVGRARESGFTTEN